MDKLKPCPFCGGYPILRSYKSEWRVECIEGGCECSPYTWWYNTKEGAIEAWNTRIGEDNADSN